MKFKSKNLLITGGAGFIGSNFVKYFLNKYSKTRLIILDKLTYAADLNNLKDFIDSNNCIFIEGDICDLDLLDRIFNKFKIDGVINFAAESHVDNSILNPQVFINSNYMGVFNLLSVANKYWMIKPFKNRSEYKTARFHQISTDEVYGSIVTGSFNENSKYKPNSPYSSTKAAADLLVRSFNKTYGLNTSISICSNNFGPNQNIEKFIPKIIQSIKNNSEIPIYGKGANIRDWIYVMDHCEAVDLIFNNSKKGSIYNVGGQNEMSNLDLVDRIYFLNNSKQKKIKFIDDRYGHDFRYSVDISKINEHFGWKPKYNFDDEILNLLK